MTVASSSFRVFNNAAARDSWLPMPAIGQACLLIDTGEILYYYGAYLGWRQAWNTGWGQVAQTVDVTIGYPVPVTLGEVLISGFATPVQVVEGRNYRIAVSCAVSQGLAAALHAMMLRVYDGAPSEGLIIGQPSYPIHLEASGTQVPVAFTIDHTFAVPSHGIMAKTINVTAAMDASATVGGAVGGLVTGSDYFPQTLTVDDVGPAANPVYP